MDASFKHVVVLHDGQCSDTISQATTLLSKETFEPVKKISFVQARADCNANNTGATMARDKIRFVNFNEFLSHQDNFAHDFILILDTSPDKFKSFLDEVDKNTETAPTVVGSPHYISQLGEHLPYRIRQESNLYRVNSILSSEVVRSLYAIRFANVFFMPIWNRYSIDSISLTHLEPNRIGIAEESSFKIVEKLLPVLAVVCMEKPISTQAEHIRNERLKVLKVMEGNPKGFQLEEDKLDLELKIKNERWDNVPIQARIELNEDCGEAMTEINISFHNPPAFFVNENGLSKRNILQICISPVPCIRQSIVINRPGIANDIVETVMDMTIPRSSTESIKDGFEKIIFDVLHSDKTHFIRKDELMEINRIFTGSVSNLSELNNEYDLTPLHLASYSGGENVVRALLNDPGCNVECQSKPSAYIPLHLACIGGHVGIVGLLLSRSTELLKVVDAKGRTCLHVAAKNGHLDMVQVLLGQGASLSHPDSSGWLPIHHAAHSGFLDVVKQLVDSGSPVDIATAEGKTPLWYATAQSNFNVVTYLLRQDHSTDTLLADKKFVINLMGVGRNHKNKPIEDFVFVSPSPCYTAAKLSSLYREMALKEKDRAIELLEIGNVCEEMTKDLVGIAANIESPGIILNSLEKSTSFIDILIANEQKIAISQYVVQQYLQEIWQGHLQFSALQFILLFSAFVFFPPLWFVLSLPVAKGLNRVPVVKFMSYLTSHLYFMAFLALVSAFPPDSTARDSLIPVWYEIVVWIWYAGILLAQITNPGNKGGLSWVKYLLVVLGVCSGIAHLVAIFVDPYWWSFIIYIRNLFFGFSLLFATIQILDFLSFHHLFGPWAIIIGELLLDVGKFVVVLCLFIAGFSLTCSALNVPFGFPDDYLDDSNLTLAEKFASDTSDTNPIRLFELLFFALFGLNNVGVLIISPYLQSWTETVFKATFASYLLLTVIVLINLLIAMMSDTYQRIQQQSDIEWKFGLAKLIRNMEQTQVAPSPINLLTTWIVVIHSWCVRGKKDREYARIRFRQAMQEELLVKAPGMKYVIDLPEETRLTPRVIHALGNINWGFTSGLKPISVEEAQSKWDKEHMRKSEHHGHKAISKFVDEVHPTSRAVNWAQVIRQYLSIRGREGELKEHRDDEHVVRNMMKSLVDIRNDGSQHMARMQAVRWNKIPNEAKKHVIEKWEEKARSK